MNQPAVPQPTPRPPIPLPFHYAWLIVAVTFFASFNGAGIRGGPHRPDPSAGRGLRMVSIGHHFRDFPQSVSLRCGRAGGGLVSGQDRAAPGHADLADDALDGSGGHHFRDPVVAVLADMGSPGGVGGRRHVRCPLRFGGPSLVQRPARTRGGHTQQRQLHGPESSSSRSCCSSLPMSAGAWVPTCWWPAPPRRSRWSGCSCATNPRISAWSPTTRAPEPKRCRVVDKPATKPVEAEPAAPVMGIRDAVKTPTFCAPLRRVLHLRRHGQRTHRDPPASPYPGERVRQGSP